MSTGRLRARTVDDRNQRKGESLHPLPSPLTLPTPITLPQNGMIKLYKELRCPLDDFELVLWTTGTNGKVRVYIPPLPPNPPHPHHAATERDDQTVQGAAMSTGRLRARTVDDRDQWKGEGLHPLPSPPNPPHPHHAAAERDDQTVQGAEVSTGRLRARTVDDRDQRKGEGLHPSPPP